MPDNQLDPLMLARRKPVEEATGSEWKSALGALGLILALPLIITAILFGDDIWYWSEDNTADAAIESYEASGDLAVLQEAALQGDREAFRVSDYLIMNRHPLLIERYLELNAIVETIIPNNWREGIVAEVDVSTVPQIRRDREYHWMRRSSRTRFSEADWPSIIDLRLFEGVLPADVPDFLPESLVYGVPSAIFHWKYTDGSTGSQPTLTAYVLDLEQRAILASGYFEGGMPSETVANYNPFSSRSGSRVDLDDVEDWYFALPLAE